MEGFHEAILATHGTDSIFLWRERVVETFEGETVWEGEVLVFELVEHQTAARWFCWEVDGQVTAVLKEGPVKSPQDAVRASIMADEEAGKA